MKSKKVDTKDILVYLLIVATGAAAFLWMVQPVLHKGQAEETSHPVRVYERDVETLVYGHDPETEFAPGVHTGGVVTSPEEVFYRLGGKSMEYAQVKEFLDECVRDFKSATKERHLTNQINLSVSNEISVLVYKGLEMMADIMGLEINEEPNPGNIRYRYSFVYDGVEFVSYENERLERFAGNGK